MVSASSTISKPKDPVPMIRLQKDIDELFAGRKSLTRSGSQTTTISSIYLLRQLPEQSEPILYLLHAPKKFIKAAHERNKLKRWMREAVRKNKDFDNMRVFLLEKKLQILLLLRSDFRPSAGHAWHEIEEDISTVTKRLIKNLHSS